MSLDTKSTSKRIAKNTGVLYIRMLFLMAVGFYTSRVILQALGVDDFGTYNVVGGFVAMFAVLSKSLSSAASRFLNYEMGKGNDENLKKVFSTTVNIQIVLAIIIAIFCEAVGIWFVNNKMVIAPDRLYAANWVFQFSVFTFCSNLLTVPYNAAIIAHERMKAFAYVSIFEGIARLAISYAVMISPIDTLIFYAALICLLQFSIQMMYVSYCKRHFEECTYHFVYDKPMLKEIFSYSGWNFIGTASATLRNQGGNILINLFFGPAVNAARAVANQVLQAVDGFAQNFMMAIKPQITQNYASGNYEYMMTLVFKGSRMTYYLLYTLSLPILLNTEYLLDLWLEEVPDHAVLFVQLTLIFTMLEHISGTLITAQLATGKIRNYQLVVGGLQMLNLPISYIVYRLGGFAESFLIVAIICGIGCLFARLYMLRTMIDLKIRRFVKEVLLNILFVTIVSLIFPILLNHILTESFISFICVSALALLCALLAIYFVGLDATEKKYSHQMLLKIKTKIIK